MQALENEWEPVKLQTGWRLEPCTKPITTPSTSAASPQTILEKSTHEPSATVTDSTQSSSQSSSDDASASHASDHDPFLDEAQLATEPSLTQ